MDTDRLKYFCAIVEFGSLSKASEVMGISHSGLSKSLTMLQKEVDLQLLRPLGRGLEVTPEGKLFYQKSLKVLQSIEELTNLDVVADKIIKIGLSEALAINCSGLISKALQQNLKITHLDVGEMEHSILNNQIDFGISSVLKPIPELEYLSIGKIRFNSYAKEDLYKKHKEHTPYAVPLSDLPQNLMGYKLRDGWPLNLKRNSVFQVQTSAIAMDLLRSGESAVYIPDFVAKRENALISSGLSKLVAIKEHKKAQTDREYFLIKLKNVPETSPMKKVSRVIRKLSSR